MKIHICPGHICPAVDMAWSAELVLCMSAGPNIGQSCDNDHYFRVNSIFALRDSELVEARALVGLKRLQTYRPLLARRSDWTARR